MTDKAHKETDKMLEEMEQHLSAIYEDASKDIEAKAQEYFDRFKDQDEKMRKKVEQGKMTEDEYIAWRKKKMLYGKRYTDLQRSLAEELRRVNEVATSYVNDQLPAIYVLNYNDIKDTAERLVKGYSFSLINSDTVKMLSTRHKTLLPYKYVNGRKDVRWNTKNVNSAVMQGILQGESIPNMGKSLRSVTEMNRASSIRNARTATTAAENYGRLDSYQRMQDEGREVTKIWTATLDLRTRHAHGMLDGQEKPLNEPFVVTENKKTYKIMMPGDINAKPEMVYNCRCRLYRKVGAKKTRERMARININGKETNVLVQDMTYQQWLEWRQNGSPIPR